MNISSFLIFCIGAGFFISAGYNCLRGRHLYQSGTIPFVDYLRSFLGVILMAIIFGMAMLSIFGYAVRIGIALFVLALISSAITVLVATLRTR